MNSALTIDLNIIKKKIFKQNKAFDLRKLPTGINISVHI